MCIALQMVKNGELTDKIKNVHNTMNGEKST